MNWPVFDGAQFVGVYDRRSREIHVFDAEDHGSTAIDAKVVSVDDRATLLSARAAKRLEEDLELLDVAGDPTTPTGCSRATCRRCSSAPR
jgi:peptide chain release factor 3